MAKQTKHLPGENSLSPAKKIVKRRARKAGATKAQPASSKGTIGSLAKGLRILEYVTSSPSKIRLRSVAAHFGMDRSAAFRFLATLEQFYYVTKDAETKAYSPGPGLARLWRQARPRRELIEIAKPFLNRLSEVTGQTGYLAMLESNRALLLEVSPGHNVVSVRHFVGQLEPLYCTSVGKAILAMLPPSEQEEILRKLTLKKNTPRTISSKAVLKRQLLDIRATGIAFDECEWRDEICCIGAPILDETGYPVAAVGLSMVDALIRGGPRAQTVWIDMVRQSAREAGKVMSATSNPFESVRNSSSAPSA